MPKHHHSDETYFGEDYYDEVAEQESIQSDIEENDPYAQANRLHRQGQQNPITYHPDYVDEQDLQPRLLDDEQASRVNFSKLQY